MPQTAIPYLFLRGGTSRGPFFRREDLPEDLTTLRAVLVSAVGSGHVLNIDGIGGGNAVTTKVAMLSKSDDDWADVDYFFAQVGVENGLVDFKPTCGNMLAGVGPAAVELGLVAAQASETLVRIRAVNTGARILAKLQTPDGQVTYEGDAVIDGVPGTHAPIALNFMDVAGSSVGAMLPTGNLRDTVSGVEVTCMDVAMPMVIARGADFGVDCTESFDDLDANKELFASIETVRLKAAVLMGMGDCSKSVTPKFGLLAPAAKGGSIAARYFMPWSTHPTLAVTGSQCLAACALAPGTIADGMMDRPETGPATLYIEHPLGQIEVVTDFTVEGGEFQHISGGIGRTARLLARGEVFVPQNVWGGQS